MSKFIGSDHFVYQHCDPNNFHSPVYIGIGNSRQRAYQIKGRDKAHRKWLEGIPHDYDYVEFLQTGLSRYEAEVIETGLIRELDPIYNIRKRDR